MDSPPAKQHRRPQTFFPFLTRVFPFGANKRSSSSMARSISNAKLVSSFLVDRCSVVARRGYAAASQGGVSENVRSYGIAMMKKAGEESTRSSPWVPDPVTGYYKPEGHVNQVDAAELRELLLKHKTRGN
ncbi:hypothetical protein L6452_04364 [Arctium lappa]|uniref:Uncharacterized protein n=1 Tax=Arctium lappa TaxID=4217 RepID=A0ACB9FQP5_ARCLA|nr:hypothetical protein L6452_04364 [Arctium lappa]